MSSFKEYLAKTNAPTPEMPRPGVYESYKHFGTSFLWNYKPEEREEILLRETQNLRELFYHRAGKLLMDGRHYATHFETHQGDGVIYSYGYVLLLDRSEATKIGDQVYVSNDPRIRDIRGVPYARTGWIDSIDPLPETVFVPELARDVKLINMRDGFRVQETGHRTFELNTAHWRNGGGVRYLELVSIHGYGFEIKPDDILLEDANQQGAGEHDIELEN